MMPWMLDGIKTVAGELPALLKKHGEGNEFDALQELAQTYQKRRAGTIPDRGDEIAKNRAEVDTKLRERGE